MKMGHRDVGGSLYSTDGLRFGGYDTHLFLAVTAPLVRKNPEVRERIVAEAHYLRFWSDRFAEIGFALGIIVYRSWWAATALFALAHALEITRFWLFGASPQLSWLCRFWGWVKIPLFLGLAVLLWSDHRELSIIVVAFLVLQGFFTALSTVLLSPIRMIAQRLAFLRRGRPWNNYEVVALNAVIRRWAAKLGVDLADRNLGRRNPGRNPGHSPHPSPAMNNDREDEQTKLDV